MWRDLLERYRRIHVYTVDPGAEAMASAVTAGTAGDHPMVSNKAVEAAILMTLGHLYANREQVVVGAAVAEMPFGPRALLRPHRIFPGF